MESGYAQAKTVTSCVQGQTPKCYDKGQAQVLKIVSIFAILIASLIAVALPLIGKKLRFINVNGTTFVVAKLFAAGVILSTAFMHNLKEGAESLLNPCLPEQPWGAFPWWAFFCMVAIIFTHMVEFAATAYYRAASPKRGQDDSKEAAAPAHEVLAFHQGPIAVGDSEVTMSVNGHHNDPAVRRGTTVSIPVTREVGDWNGMHGQFGHPVESGDETMQRIRNVVVAQVLEIGIVSHSIFIGLALGVSYSPCEIRTMLAAIVFHQFFEGIALGGCILQAGFRVWTYASMGVCFAMTTPVGVVLGIIISRTYNPLSTTALLTEGILNSLSAGILIYMSLVNLMASEFMSERMFNTLKLQLLSWTALLLGVAAMAVVGIWA